MQHNRINDTSTYCAKSGTVVRTVFTWIVETDRRFRLTQNRVDRFADRF